MATEESRTYVGIDPSLTSTGVAGLIGEVCFPRILRTSKTLRGVPRLIEIRGMLHEFLSEMFLFGKVIQAAVEGPSLGSTNRADDLGQLRGIILTLLADRKIPTIVVPPTSVKKFAGYGGARKDYMIAAAEERWPKTMFQEDTADAAWLAAVAKGMHETKGLTRKQTEVLFGMSMPKVKTRISTKMKGNI
jgi:Holliday junction resolvasome RuvABC endonuclease subunit